MNFKQKDFSKYFFLLTVISLTSNIQAAFRPAGPGEDFRDIAMTHQAYATELHFAPVGAVIGGDILGTGTLAGKNDRIITCAHTVEAARAENKILCFRLPIGQGSILKLGEYREYPIKEWIIAPDFRRGGPDIAVGILESAVEGVECATIGLIPNTVLSEKLYDDIPCAPGIRPDPRYRFSSATIGRNGPWNINPKEYPQTDGKKRAYNCYLNSRVEVIDEAQAIGFSSSSRIASAKGISEMLGEICSGSSGGPLFIKNVKSKEQKWRLFAVAQSGGPSHVYGDDYKSCWTPLANLPSDFLSKAGF